MQTISANLKAALIDIDARVTPRILVDLYEFYASDYVPGVGGFDPDDAEERFAGEEITWDGNAYRREIQAGGGRGDIVRSMTEKTNSVTIKFSNISRYLATWAQTEPIEGKFLVIRTVVPSVTDDSLVLFVGRCDKPSDIDKQSFSLSARQDFGNINQEIPPRQFTADDPNGRTPSDLLYEGFRLTALQGSFSVPVTTASTSFFGRLFGKMKTKNETRQWSSLDATPYGSVLPMVFGRCQMEGIPIQFADIGYSLIGVWAICEGRIDTFTNVEVRDERFQLATVEYHYGDPGGTGSNATNTSGPINQGYLSKAAYAVISIRGSEGDTIDESPTITQLVRGMRVPVPDSDGVFGSSAWSDNPVAVARFILTDPRLVGIDPAFMDDDVNYQTFLHCAEPIIDDSNSEVTLVPAPDLPQAGIAFRRFWSTGIITPRWVLFNYLGETTIFPEFLDVDYTPYDIDDVPITFAVNRLLRKRYTFNAPITDRVRAVDFAYKTVNPTAKLFYRVNKKGKYEIRSEQSSDATMLRSGTSVGDTSLPVLDVTPWKTGPDLLIGRLLLGFSLITSEVRNVSSALYSTSGNSITLAASATGGVTATESGANLSGGSTTVPAAGTVVIAGTPGAGDTVTIEIDGIEIVYTLTAEDTIETVAAILSSYINATPQLRRYISSAWDPLADSDTLTITAKNGTLTLDSQLLKAHAGPIADPTTTPSLGSSAGALEAGTYKLAYADVTALGQTALSPLASTTIIASKQIDVGAIALVGTSRNWYMSDAANSQHLKFVANTNGSAFSVNALPLPHAALPRDYNTTGEEMIRVAMSFATNSQDIFPAWSPSRLVVNGDTYLPSTPNAHRYQATTSAAVAAAGGYEIDFGDNMAAGQQWTLNGVAYTFTVSGAGTYEIQIGANATITATNAAAKLNAASDPLISVATYSSAGRRVDIVHDTPGAAGNSYTTTSTGGAPVSADATTLFGGSDAAETTGATEPAWPTTPAGTVNDNGITWTEVGATYLGQAGLTRANIKKDSFKWPLGSRQSSVNQIKGSYRDANNDFALTPFKVNDPIHQAQVNKVYPLEVDLSAVDNWNQAFRLANWQLAKNREGDWFNALETGPQGLILEEGDVICASDDSGGLVNVATRIEELRIKPNHDVAIAQARKYSSLMFADEVGADTIPIPTTLRYVQTVDSIAEFLDTAPTRDSDGLFPGFYLPVSRDLSDIGDWRGWSLYADYGDGYVRIAHGDIPAVIGVATSILPNVTDPTEFDNVNELTLTLQYGPPAPFPNPFASVSEAELLTNPRRNLFRYGDEYIQAATVVDNGNQSYTLSDLLRERFDTEQGHVADERVVYIDGSEVFVPIDFSRLNIEYDYKVVTTNQDVDDAAVVPFTWTGNILRPWKPINVVIARDGGNDWLIQFELRLRAGDPQLAKVEVWASEDRSDPGTDLLRTLPVTIGTTHACLLDSSGDAVYDPNEEPGYVLYTSSHADRNNLVAGVGPAQAQTLETLQDTYTRYDFTFRVNDDASVVSSGALIEAAIEEDAVFDTSDRSPDASVSPVFIEWAASGSGATVTETIKSFGATVGTPRVFDWDADGQTVRYTILLSGTEYRVYADYNPGAGQVPLVIVTAPGAGFPFPMRLKMSLVDASTGPFWIDNVIAGGNLIPTTIYSEREQIEDFTVAQSRLYLRLYQVSKYPEIGAGFPLDIIVPGFELMTQAGDFLLTEAGDILLLE